jgi:hypothetical protein
MSGTWRPRVARDGLGRLRLVYARYRYDEPRQRCGLSRSLDVFAPAAAGSVESLRAFARGLLAACDEPVISMAEFDLEPRDDD